MTSPQWAKLSARLLASVPDAAPAPIALADRAKLISSIERTLREKGRRQARMRWVTRLSIAAAVLLAVGAVGWSARKLSTPSTSLASIPVAPAPAPTPPAPQLVPSNAAPAATVAIVGHSMGGDVTVTSPGSTSSLTEGKPLLAGTRVAPRAGGRALLAFATGTQLTVDEDSELTIVEQGPSQIFSLSFGAVHADVAKLAVGERFIVRTEDAEVEARGTSFRVATAAEDATCGNGALTRVAVFEGTVTVRHRGGETNVRAGEAWPARGTCGAAPKVASARKPHRARQSAASAWEVATPVESESRLKEINDAFASALSAKQTLSPTAAVGEFDKFIAAYPSCALTETATVERMKLLASLDAGRGATAANAYLARFPNGSARRTAEAIAAGRP